MRYATRVKANPAYSVVADQREENIAHFLKGAEAGAPLPEFTRVRSIILALFGLTFALMLYGVIKLGWWMGQMSALFLGMAILTWFVGKFAPETRLDEETFVNTFVNGARDLLGVALIIGVARGIVVVMDAGKITDTILNALAGSLAGLGNILFINTMLVFQTLLSFLVPSSSGLAVLTMPILAPLSDFAGVNRDLTVTAYQSANGWVNLFNPTFAVVMGGLAIGRVSYDRWLRFVWPLLVIIMIIIVAALSVGTLGSGGSNAPPAATLRLRPRPPARAAETMAREHAAQLASETASSRGRILSFSDSSSSRGNPDSRLDQMAKCPCRRPAGPPVSGKGGLTMQLGVHSEIGKLRKVMVSRPSLAHERLTPGNCHDLLFDDVIWVQKARSDHADFVLRMKDRDIEVYDIQDLLTDVFNTVPEGRAFVLDRRITDNQVGPALARILRPWLDELDGHLLARHLLGGIVRADLPPDMVTPVMREALSASEFIVRPVPNALFQRDPSCWIYGGVTCNPMFWPARQPETLYQRAVYKFHPHFTNNEFEIWWGDSDENWGYTSMEGGDVMPIGKGVVLIGMGERTTRQAVNQVANRLFEKQAARAGHRLRHAEVARGDASRHGFHLSRLRQGHGLPRGGGRHHLFLAAPRRQWRSRDQQGRHAPLRGLQGGARPQRPACRRHRAATSSSKSASSGTTATMSSRSSPA